jgi:hypothetical protein
MRLACILAIALVLNLPVAGMACEQEAPGSTKTAGQAPAAVAAPSEKTTPETAPVAGQNAPESVAKKKTDADSASGTAKRRQRPASAPDGAPRKIVVRQGGASEPAAQIAPDITPAEATRERQSTEQLLGATGGQLKQLAGRTLDAQQQETVGQIRNYINGAHSALQEGDVRRASTLAQKAHLLAEDLVKH